MCVCVYGVAQWEEFFQGNSHFFCILLTMRGESQLEIFHDIDRLDNLLIESLEDKMRNCGRKFSFFSKKPKACAAKRSREKSTLNSKQHFSVKYPNTELKILLSALQTGTEARDYV